jgi:hypothetical protein
MRKQMRKSGITLPRAAIAAVVAFLGLLWGESILPGGGPRSTPFVTAAYAWVGRPATPVSYAGVARRTTRRTVAVTAPYR